MAAATDRPDTHDRTDEDPTMWAVDAIEAAGKSKRWGHITRNVPVFVPHIVKSRESKEHLYTVDENRLRAIAEKIRNNQSGGKYVKLYDRHSYPSRHMSQTEQPRLLGLAANPQVGYYGPHKELALKLDFFFPHETWDMAKDLPERSAEFKPGSDGFPAVALLKTEPRLNMGQVIYSANPGEDDGLYIYQGVDMQATPGQVGLQFEVDDVVDEVTPGVRPIAPAAPQPIKAKTATPQATTQPVPAPTPRPSGPAQVSKPHAKTFEQFRSQVAGQATQRYDQCGEEDICPETTRMAVDSFMSSYGRDSKAMKYMMAAYQANFPPTMPTNGPVPPSVGAAPMPGAPMDPAAGGMPGQPGMPGDPASMLPPAPGQPGLPPDGIPPPEGPPMPGDPMGGGMPGGASGAPIPGQEPMPGAPMQPPGAQPMPTIGGGFPDPNNPQPTFPMQSFSSGTNASVPMQEVYMSDPNVQMNYAAEINQLKAENQRLTQGIEQGNVRYQQSEALRIVGELRSAGKEISDPEGLTRYMSTLGPDQQLKKAKEILQNWKDVPRPPVDHGHGMIQLHQDSVTGRAESEMYGEFTDNDIDAAVLYCEEHKLNVEKDWDKACREVVKARLSRTG